MRGLYTVDTKQGPVVCKARGIFRENDTRPVVGDDVVIRMAPDGDIGYIEEVLERKNQLTRPPVANIDRALVVMSLTSPDINTFLLDSFLVLCEKEGLHAEIVFSKADLTEDTEQETLRRIYQPMGYGLHFTSTVTGEGMDEVKALLSAGTTALAGPSGVGKSSLLQSLYPDFSFETGAISEKTRRGRHTTRHIEITKISDGAYVLDTPGFQTLELTHVEPDELGHYFPDFPQGACRFDNCLHDREPGCAVKVKLEAGDIAAHRYENYQMLLQEAKEQRRY